MTWPFPKGSHTGFPSFTHCFAQRFTAFFKARALRTIRRAVALWGRKPRRFGMPPGRPSEVRRFFLK